MKTQKFTIIEPLCIVVWIANCMCYSVTGVSGVENGAFSLLEISSVQSGTSFWFVQGHRASVLSNLFKATWSSYDRIWI